MDNNIHKEKEYIRYFLEGRLSQENEAKLLQWIHAYESATDLFIQHQDEMAGFINRKKDRETNSGWRRLRSRISEGSVIRSLNRRTTIYTSIAAAFILGALLTTAVLWEFFKRETPQVQMHTVSVPFGAKSTFILPDGTSVWLNAGSEFTYPSVFKDERAVNLDGEAYFEVEKGNLPFLITTPYGVIEVTGTDFNVSAYSDNRNFETTLITGSVRVNGNQNAVVLKPGQQAFISDNKLKIREVDTELYISWKEGKLIFVREPFPDLMKKLEHWFNVEIDYEDSKLADIWYTGTIEMETITEVMEMVSKAAHVDYFYNSKTRIITIKPE